MYSDAICLANPVIKLSQQIDSNNFYKITDQIIAIIDNFQDDRLTQSKQILEDIKYRKLFKYHGEIVCEKTINRLNDNNLISKYYVEKKRFYCKSIEYWI